MYDYRPAIQNFIKQLNRKQDKENNQLIKEIIQQDINEAKKYLNEYNSAQKK